MTTFRNRLRSVLPIFAAVALAWVYRVRPARILASLAVTSVLLITGYALVAPLRTRLDRTWERAVSTTDTTTDGSNRDHLDLWHEGLRISLDHPLLGTGQETFPEMFPTYERDLPYLTILYFNQYRVESPHNVYLAISAGTGFPALASYLTIICSFAFYMLRVARRLPRSATKLLCVMIVAAVAGHLVTDLFMTADLTASWLMWLLMGAGLGVATSTLNSASTRSDSASHRATRQPNEAV